MPGKSNPKVAAERRKTIRFLLAAPVILQWCEPSGEKREDIGRTHDLSTSGAFVLCRSPLPIGSEVKLEVQLPPLERNSSQLLRLKGCGKVTRTSAPGRGGGFAATVQFTLEEGDLDVSNLFGAWRALTQSRKPTAKFPRP